jgi:hypothetical protein
MANTLIDVRAPGRTGNNFDGYCKCPKCGAVMQLTIQNRTGTRFEAVCSCGQPVKAQLLSATAIPYRTLAIAALTPGTSAPRSLPSVPAPL